MSPRGPSLFRFITAITYVVIWSICSDQPSACACDGFSRLFCNCFRPRSSSNKVVPLDSADPDINFSNINGNKDQVSSTPAIGDFKWFAIDPGVILRNENAVLNLMLVATAFNIAQRTSFLALYLPPDTQRDQQIQAVYDYWKRFSEGAGSFDLERALRDLPNVRETTLNLWSTVHYIERQQSEPIESTNQLTRLYRKIFKTNNESPRESLSLQSSITLDSKPLFYSMKRLYDVARPLEFVGIPESDVNMKIFEVKAVTRKIVELIDRFEEILTGHCNVPRTLNAMTHPTKTGRASQVFYNSFFRGFGFDDITIKLQPMVAVSLLRLSPKQRKLVLFNSETFMMNILYFANTVRMQKELKAGQSFDMEKTNIQFSQERLGREPLFRVEVHFKEELISKEGFDKLNSHLTALMESNRIWAGITFDDMRRNNGELFLLVVLSTFADSRGGCGIRWPHANHGGGQAIFCVWNPNQETITKHTTVPEHAGRSRDSDYAFADQRFDDPEQDARFLDSDLLSQVRLRMEV